MGFYLSGAPFTQKAIFLLSTYGGTLFNRQITDLKEIPNDQALVVVVHNPSFESAVVVYCQEELDRVLMDRSGRKTEWIALDDRRLIYARAGIKEALLQ